MEANTIGSIKVKNKENRELMHFVGRRLREVADAGQTLPDSMRRCLDALQAAEVRNMNEMSPAAVHARQARRPIYRSRSQD